MRNSKRKDCRASGPTSDSLGNKHNQATNTHGRHDDVSSNHLASPHRSSHIPISIAIPSLTTWTQTHLARLYASESHNHNHNHKDSEAESEHDFHSTFISTFSDKAEVYTNHVPVTLDALEERISGKRGATVEWRDVVEVPASGEDGEKVYEAGIVAGFAIVTRSLKFRIRAAPAQMHTFIVFNAKIEQDPTAQPDEHGDRRRIVHLFETTLDRAAAVHLQKPRVAHEED